MPNQVEKPGREEFCPQCAVRLAPGARFCNKCGTAIPIRTTGSYGESTYRTNPDNRVVGSRAREESTDPLPSSYSLAQDFGGAPSAAEASGDPHRSRTQFVPPGPSGAGFARADSPGGRTDGYGAATRADMGVDLSTSHIVAPPRPRSGGRAFFVFGASALLLAIAAGALGVWLGQTYFDRSADDGATRSGSPVANAPAGGGDTTASVGDAPSPTDASSTPDDSAPDAPAEVGTFAILADETGGVESPELALGAPDGRFAVVDPGGSLAVVLPEGHVLHDEGLHTPDVRVSGDAASKGPYEIDARTADGGFVRIDRVRNFGKHDMGHHHVAEADAFRIRNTGSKPLRIDSVEPLRQPVAK